VEPRASARGNSTDARPRLASLSSSLMRLATARVAPWKAGAPVEADNSTPPHDVWGVVVACQVGRHCAAVGWTTGHGAVDRSPHPDGPFSRWGHSELTVAAAWRPSTRVGAADAATALLASHCAWGLARRPPQRCGPCLTPTGDWNRRAFTSKRGRRLASCVRLLQPTAYGVVTCVFLRATSCSDAIVIYRMVHATLVMLPTLRCGHLLQRRLRGFPALDPPSPASILTSPSRGLSLPHSFLGLLIIDTSSYFVTAKQKQASYTGTQPRGVVCALLFMVEALFGDACGGACAPLASGPLPFAEQDDVTDRTAAPDGASALAGDAFGRACDGAHGGAANDNGGADEGDDADHEDDAPNVKKGFKYYWSAYRAAFGIMPVHRAVTEVFVEHASLYSPIAGQVTTFFPPPMTVEEGADIGAQATRFVNNFVTPLVGKMNSTKVHRPIEHVCHCIQYHGNLKNGSTGANEAMPKAYKAYYLRTNKNRKTFKFQLVRHGQGALAALAKLETKDKERAQARGGSERGNAHGRRRMARAARCSMNKTYQLKQVAVGEPAQRPRLARLSSVLRLEKADRLKVIRPANSRFKSLLEYRTYFLTRHYLSLPSSLVEKTHKMSRRLDGAFQGKEPFTGTSPLGVLTFLTIFRCACDAAGLTHGQAVPLLPFSLSGAPGRAFQSALNSKAGYRTYAIRAYRAAINWLLAKYASHVVMASA